MFSISAVFASDDASLNETGNILTSQDGNEDLTINENTLISEQNTTSSFSDLSTAINSASQNVDLTCDYEFNEETDGEYVDGILIDKDDFTINGNNHVIDAKNMGGLFTITSTNVTLNNIIFKNSDYLALNITKGSVTTNNVTFMNCGANSKTGGAIYLSESYYESNNDKFIDNYAKYGSAIFAHQSVANINNDTFRNDEYIYWSLIYAFDSNLTVQDTVFTNITSKYATAVFTQQSYTIIRNSKFINLRASMTAGAIGLKASPTLIEDCEFINVSSSKNGGAVFVDVSVYEIGIIVNNTLFENCESEFGGAYLQVEGNCTIINSTFKNNIALENGGAIYVSTLENMTIADSIFTDNEVVQYEDYNTFGGAVYFDNSFVEVSDSIFTDNKASYGGALYFYECDYVLNNLEFNGNGIPIYTFFEEESERNNITGGSDIITDELFNNTYYPDVVYGPGKQLILIDSPFNFTELPSRLNLVDYGLVTPVKDQGSQGSCWAFGTIAALESALLLKTGVEYDFSENNLQKSMLIYSQYGSTAVTESGFNTLGFGYLLNWFGMLNQSYDEYDELGKITALFATGDDIHIQDIVFLTYQPGISESIDEIKRAIVEYGALMGTITFGATAFDEGPETYNETWYSLYTPEYQPPNHMITIVGWDDNFPKEHFTETPPGDGAWIIKNSWGTEWGDNGYFYISYYDPTLANYENLGIGGALVAIKLDNTIQYTKNYQYDFVGIADFVDGDNSIFRSVNQYVAYEDDVIAAVGTYFDPDTDYTIEILINDTVVYKQQGKSSYFGYHTIMLDSYVSIKQGETFAVAVTTPYYKTMSTDVRVKYQPGVSISESDFHVEDGTDLGTVNCIKAYTLAEPFSAERIVEKYSERKAFKVNVTKSNELVSISFENETMTNVSDENGIATFNLPLLEHGTHSIYVTYNGSTVISTVTVLSTIDVPDEIIVPHHSSMSTTVTFYDLNGTPLASVILPMPQEMGNYTYTFTNPVTGEVRNVTVNITSRFLIHDNHTTWYVGEQYSVMVAGDDGKPANGGGNVTFSMLGKTNIAEISENGLATVVMPEEAVPGKYTLYATYMGETVSIGVTITHLIRSNETVTVQLTDYSLDLEAVLFIKFAPYVNETVTFKLNGKTYTAITDEGGVASVTIGQDDIKKLKAGKYTIEITFIYEVLKTTLEVKQPLSTASTVSIKNIDSKMVLSAELKTDGVAQANKKITFKFNGKTYTATTDKNGIAKVTIKKNVIKKLKAGKKYTVTISYLNDVIKSTVKVKKILSSKKMVTVKKTAKKLVLKATLKDGKTPLKNKKITFKFNGKTYKAKTNKKGIAKVTIKKNVIKKLKAGKKYTAKISYFNNVVKTKVKVKK